MAEYHGLISHQFRKTKTNSSTKTKFSAVNYFIILRLIESFGIFSPAKRGFFYLQDVCVRTRKRQPPVKQGRYFIGYLPGFIDSEASSIGSAAAPGPGCSSLQELYLPPAVEQVPPDMQPARSAKALFPPPAVHLTQPVLWTALVRL